MSEKYFEFSIMCVFKFDFIDQWPFTNGVSLEGVSAHLVVNNEVWQHQCFDSSNGTVEVQN